MVSKEYADAHKGEHIGQYDMPNYVGRRLIVDEDPGDLTHGEGALIKSYEKDKGCETTERVHQFE